MFVFLHVAWNNQNQTNVFFVLACRMHGFLEEMCVAGGTVFVLILHVSGRRQFKRGTCDV